jgi:hypothetical protein
VPGIIGRLIAAKAACMITDDNAILLDDDAISVSVDVDVATDGAGFD